MNDNVDFNVSVDFDTNLPVVKVASVGIVVVFSAFGRGQIGRCVICKGEVAIGGVEVGFERNRCVQEEGSRVKKVGICQQGGRRGGRSCGLYFIDIFRCRNGACEVRLPLDVHTD